MGDATNEAVLQAINTLDGKVDGLRGDLHKLELQLAEQNLGQMQIRLTAAETKLQDHETRWARLMGTAAGVSAVCGGAVAAILQLLTGGS